MNENNSINWIILPEDIDLKVYSFKCFYKTVNKNQFLRKLWSCGFFITASQFIIEFPLISSVLELFENTLKEEKKQNDTICNHIWLRANFYFETLVQLFLK